MQAIMESVFCATYLIIVITLGCYIIRNNNGNKQYKIFGIMALVLGCGDAFHLVPRVIALCTTGLENYTAALGFGKLVTSVTMTVFYVLLYHVWQLRYNYEGGGKKTLRLTIYELAIVRIALCVLPQNRWLYDDSPLLWGIYRNIPFAIIGIIIIAVYFWMAKKNNDRQFRFLWLAVFLSFAFYIPVVLWADTVPPVGMLMLPKTCAYVWIIWMGFSEVKSKKSLT
jgi:hypothetical protein